MRASRYTPNRTYLTATDDGRLHTVRVRPPARGDADRVAIRRSLAGAR